MAKRRKSIRWRIASVVGFLAVAGYMIFGPSDGGKVPLGVGQAKVTAQPSQTFEGQSFSFPLGPGGGETQHTGAIPPPSAAKVEARERHEDDIHRAFAARAADRPAMNITPRAAPPLTALAPRTAVDLRNKSSVPPPNLDGSIAVYRATEIDPPAGFSASVNEPAAAQNGRFAFETWNWFAGASADGGASFALVNPETYGPGMADFCCDQDVIFDKGNNRFFWERMGIDDVNGGTGGSNGNRILINVSPDGFFTNSCFADIRPGQFGLSNAFMDYPRLALSNNYIYMSLNIYSFVSPPSIGGFITHILVRYDLDLFGDCTSATGTFWNFSAGWSPTLVENAREIMYLGDHIITNPGGLNSTFRVYWIFDDNTTLNAVDRAIDPWLYTNGNASCPVPGGSNPCARADHRIIGAVLEHNTPLPGALGAAGDKIDFYWNVAAGNGFALPYTESAGFFGNTIAYVQRKLLAFSNATVFYAAVGADDREHVGLTGWIFWPVASATNPQMTFGIDDDFNPSADSGWELWVLGALSSDANWNANNSGDYLRVRMHAPNGTGWILTGTNRDAGGGEFRPTYSVWGRGRDLNGFLRFDQQ
jgi:hypothetical protein